MRISSGGLGPGQWVAALVPAVDEGADLGAEVLDGGEWTAGCFSDSACFLASGCLR